MPDLVLINKKRTCQLVNCTVPNSENKRNRNDTKILGSCQRAEKLWIIKFTVISIVIGVQGMIPERVTKRFGKLKTRRRIETMLTTALLK